MALLVGNVQNGNKSDEYAFHGLKRRSDGTLVYSKVYYSTNETVYPTFIDGATGPQGIETDTGLTYNPSTGQLDFAVLDGGSY